MYEQYKQAVPHDIVTCYNTKYNNENYSIFVAWYAVVYISIVIHLLLTLSDVFTKALFIFVACAWDKGHGTQWGETTTGKDATWGKNLYYILWFLLYKQTVTHNIVTWYNNNYHHA